MRVKFTTLDIASYGGLMMFAISGIITPICLPEISKTLSTTLAEGGGIETARNLLIFAAIFLAGISALTWGQKRFITLGQYLLAVGLLMASFSHSYYTLIISLMIAGIGGGFTEALINPLIVNIHPNDSGKYLNITHAFYPIGVMVSALLFGELLTRGYSWRVMFRIAAAGALVAGIFFNSLRFPPKTGSEHSAWKLITVILGLSGFWFFAAAIFFGAGAESAFTFWSRSYVEIYFKDVPRAGAIAVVVFAGTMVAGRFLAAKLSENISLKIIMIFSALLGVGVSIVIPFISSLVWFYIFLGLAGIASGCFWPSILAEASNCLKINPTILFVLLSCIGIVGFGLTPWLLGIIGDYTNLRTGFFVIPVFFAILVFLFTMEWHMSSRPLKTT